MNSFNKIIRYIRQNKKSILAKLGIFVGIVLVVQVLNGIVEQRRSNIESKNENNTDTSVLYQPNKTILSDTTVKEKNAKENNEIIDNFIMYCNNGEIEKAYDLLTEECKEVLYKDVNSFKNNYYNTIFTDKKEYNIQSWITNGSIYTYKVRYTEDLLSSGKSNDSTMEDYITIVKDEGKIGLNINSYISREYINKQKEYNKITFKAKYVDIYMDKEIYCINVLNYSDNEIMLDSLETTEGISLIGENNVTYPAYTNELGEYDVTVPQNVSKNIKIKFSKNYNQRRKTKQILCSDIILNKEKFKENTNEKDNRTSINIEL